MQTSATQQETSSRRPMTGPKVWDRATLDAESYMLTVEPHQAEACLRIRDDLRRRGKQIDSVEPADFTDSALAQMADAISRRVHSGAGFFVLRGLPLQGWTDEEASMLYWGLGTHLGRPLQQNRDGDRVYLVQDTGATLMEARGSKTNLAMIFHTDSAAAFVGSRPDILGLMCLRKAVSGGESLMISGHAAYNILLSTRPDLVDELYREFLFDRSKDTQEGEDPISTGPVFTDTADGVRIRYNRLAIELGHHLSGNPLTERQREALDAFDAILNDPANAIEFTMEPGDVLFADNNSLLHNRRGFDDAPEVENRRCLVRLWLAAGPGSTCSRLPRSVGGTNRRAAGRSVTRSNHSR
jgi:alpha-ketoglutarate-dependent taurine dioxygenase